MLDPGVWLPPSTHEACFTSLAPSDADTDTNQAAFHNAFA
jgi:glutamate-1-semialdehyde aminotransferase